MSAQRPTPDYRNALAGTVFEIGYRGDVSLYKVRMADRSLIKVALANAGAPPALRDQRPGLGVMAAGRRRHAEGLER